MKKITYKNKYNIKFLEIWFADKIEKKKFNADIVIYRGLKEQRMGHLQNTLITDLTQGSDALFDKIKKGYKYEINRCIKENVQFEVMDSNYLKENVKELDLFEKTYNEMYKEKGLKTRLSRYLVDKYVDNNAFLISKVNADNENGACYHAYIYDDKQTRLLYSCSIFRSQDQEMKNYIGRANKFLHWQDLCYFKSNGLKIYDWGGVFSFDNPNGIDGFKMSFGGDHLVYSNIKKAVTFKGKLFSFFSMIKSKVK